MLSGALLLIVLRAPELLCAPRFWAEEGTTYFTAALAHPWYQALFTPQFGYLSLWANLSAWLATCVPIVDAPSVTTICALSVQLAPVVLIACRPLELWQSEVQRAMALLCIVFVPLAGELWLNTINSQFYFSLTTFLLLIDAPSASTAVRWARRGLLLLGGLTGVVSCFLTPLFVWRWHRDRSGDRVIDAAILLGCSVVQAAMFWSMHQDPGVARRFMPLDVSMLGAILVTNSLLWCFAGLDTARAAATWLLAQRGTIQFVWIGAGSLLLLGGTLAWLAYGLPRRRRIVVVAAYVLLSVLSVIAATGSRTAKWVLIVPSFGGRYFYAPNVILVLMLVGNLNRGNGATRRSIAAVLLLAALFNGATQFHNVPVEGPAWREEIAHWRANPTYAPRIWPNGWSVQLPPRRED
jgi:hypothetical protein